MGLLVDGKWYDKWYDTESTGGHFVRKDSQFRNWITKDGSPGPTGEGGFKAEAGRYHLYVSYACPWASRTLIMRALKGLEDMISISVVHPHMGEHGWTFEEADGVIKDPLFDADYLYQIYTHVDPNYSGRVTVPVLYDKKTDTIVNNESSEIMRMFNQAFDDIGAKAGDYYPENLRDEIDQWNDEIYPKVNNGVYKAGFATKQSVYEEEVDQLFKELDRLEDRLSQHDYLVGDQITEADWRLFTTLVRFDSVYYGHFKCNIRNLTDYPALWLYTRKLYQWPGVKETVNFSHIKEHYYTSHPTINPNGIIPLGPDLDWSLPNE
ncbi:glutathione S-transferase family protein [Aerococcus sp. CDC-944-U94]|uniref:glutathione S-transferase family protein n=1 Tax=Aerococcus urinae (strain CCUG 59500 / ACS-120-V-Col10a) TaxID=2976812 RepID=UPI00227A443D|nr:glutathione S-transferase family protein [Aerococcus sp. Group 1]MCY3054800.1 glutathione S-transferase family protein [Aerococcus sp. Group 1]MCY3056530.1 glutathione S-transferase family protein [Aerococcus sp. Group 1]